MKKKASTILKAYNILLLLSIFNIPFYSYGKVSDFNEIISQNNKDQKELQQNIHSQVKISQDRIKKKTPKYIVGSSDSVNVPSSYENKPYYKERIKNQKSAVKSKERLATEFKDSGY